MFQWLGNQALCEYNIVQFSMCCSLSTFSSSESLCVSFSSFSFHLQLPFSPDCWVSIISVASEHFNSTDILYLFTKHLLDASFGALNMIIGLYEHASSSLKTSSNLFQRTFETPCLQVPYYRDVPCMSYATKSNPLQYIQNCCSLIPSPIVVVIIY